MISRLKEVTDISHLFSTLMDKIALLEHKVAFLEQENRQLRFKLHLVELENARLKERLSHYEKPSKDSHNSHIPASRESIASPAVRRNQSLRQPSDKPSGGQLGHKGITLAFPEKADKEEIHTVNTCPSCGKNFPAVSKVLFVTVPMSVRPLVISARYITCLSNV